MSRKIAIIGHFLAEAKKDHINAYAAQAAYFMTLSFIPFVMILLSAVKYTPVTKDYIFLLVSRMLPSFADSLAVSILEEIYAKSAATIPIAVVIAIWSSGKGVMAITIGLNTVYGVAETRNFILVRLRAVLYTIIIIVSIILSLVLMVFGKSLQALIEKRFPKLGEVSDFIMNIRLFGVAVLLVVLVVFFTMLFKFLPNRKEKLKDQLPGSVFTAGTWALYSFAFAAYIERTSGFSYMYGSLTMVIIMMLWLYFCMYLMLLGAEINSFRKDIQRKEQLQKDH